MSVPASGGPTFRRRVVGYDRAAVDAYVAAAERARRAAEAEARQLRETGEPLARIGHEVAGILRSLADSVAEVQARAEAEVAETLASAHAEAAEVVRRAEAERAEATAILDEARRQAESTVREAEVEARRLIGELVSAGTRQLEDVAGRRAEARAGLVEAMATLQAALAAIDRSGPEVAPPNGATLPAPARARDPETAPEEAPGPAAPFPDSPASSDTSPPSTAVDAATAGDDDRVVEGTEAYDPLPCADPGGLSALAAEWLREQNEPGDDRWSWL